MTRATIASINVNPAFEPLGRIKVLLANRQRAVELGCELESAAEAVAGHLDGERRHLAARQEHYLGLGVLDVLRFEIANERYLSAIEQQCHRQPLAQRARLQQAVLCR